MEIGAQIIIMSKKGTSNIISDYNNGLTDIQVIQETDGKASGQIAHEIYAFLHPEEYAKLRNQHAKNVWDVQDMRQYSIFEMPNYLYDFELPISAEQLYQEFRQSPKKLNKTLSDQFILYGQKYQNRVTEIFYDPERLKQSREAIDNKMIEIFGDTYQKPREIYNNFDFDNLESNSKLLQHVLHISKERADELAKNKEYVKDIFDQYVNNITISFRRSNNKGNHTNPTRLGIDDVMLKITGNLGGGSDHGVGGNMVRVFAENADGVYYGNFGIVTQQKLTFHPEKIKTFDDLINQINHLTENKSNEIYNMLENTYDTKAAFNRNKSNAAEIMDKIGEEAIRQDQPFWIPQEFASMHDLMRGYLGQLDRSSNKPHGYWYGRRGYRIDVPGLYSMRSILSEQPVWLTEQQLKQANERGFYTVLNELIQNEHYPTNPYLYRTKNGTTFQFNFNGINREAKKYMLNKDIINILSNKIGEEETNKIIQKNLQEAFRNHLINKEQLQSLSNKGLEEIANLDKHISDGIIRDMRNFIVKNNKRIKRNSLYICSKVSSN